MNIAALQISSIGLNPNRLEHYLNTAKNKEVKVLTLPEYVLNRFFHELAKTPLEMLKQQSEKQLTFLKELSKRYNIVIVAPIIRVIKRKRFKSVAIVKPEKTYFYDQQILINYSHWNEEKFFSNPIKELVQPPTFRIDGVKFGVLPGFEIHFDIFWQSFLKRDVDVVLVPSISTFDSNERWLHLLRSRAFVNTMYLLRVNRIGDFKDRYRWKFYGRSCSILPDGKVSMMLGESEELLIEEIQKELVRTARREWGFKSALRRRNAL